MRATFRYIPEATATFRCLDEPTPNKGPAALVLAYQGGSRTFTRTLTLKDEEQEKVDTLFQELMVSLGGKEQTGRIDLQGGWVQVGDKFKKETELSLLQRKTMAKMREVFDEALKADGRDSLTQTLPPPLGDRSERLQALPQKIGEHVQVALEGLPEGEKKKREERLVLLSYLLDRFIKGSETIQDQKFIAQIKRLDQFAICYAAATLPSVDERETLDELGERMNLEMERFADLIAKQEPGKDAAPKAGIVNRLLHSWMVGSRDPELTEGERNYIKDVILLSAADRERYIIGQKMNRLTDHSLERAMLQCVQTLSAAPLMNHPSVKILSAADRAIILQHVNPVFTVPGENRP